MRDTRCSPYYGSTGLLLWLAALQIVGTSTAGAQQRGRRDRDYDRDYRTTVDTTFDFDRRGTVSLTIGSGEIVVMGWDRDQIRIHGSSERENIRLDASPGRASVDLAEAYRGRGEAHFEVSVPVGVRVIAHAQSGDVSVTGTSGAIDVRTQSGDIKIAEAADRLDVATLSGDIEARMLSGDVQIKSVSGDIRVTGLKGDFEGESTSGSIVVRDAVARFVRSHTVSGDLGYDGAIDGDGRYELVTHSGDIRLGIPENAGAQLSVSTWSGSIESDFPITLQPGEHGIGAARSKRFTFQIGNGAARVSAETFSGDITISARGSARR
jgi:DUF4097 and DUF4098 domain-containing protein YvlB